MFNFKKIGHSLYSIERTKEFVDDLSDLLPIKVDLEKQLFIHAARNNINGLTDLMCTHHFNQSDILQLNPQKQSILTPICVLNCEKTLNFLIKSMSLKVIRDRLIKPDQSKGYPLERAIINNHYNGVLKLIFNGDKFNLINYRDQQQSTPLLLCWANKKGKCALLILENITNRKQLTSMIESTGSNMTSLQYALRTGDIDCVQFIFDQLDDNEKLKSKLLSYKGSSSTNKLTKFINNK